LLVKKESTRSALSLFLHGLLRLSPRIMTEDINVPERLGIPDYEFRVVFGGTAVDYDWNKEEINRKKHGYSNAYSSANSQRRFTTLPHLPQQVTPCLLIKFAWLDTEIERITGSWLRSYLPSVFRENKRGMIHLGE